MADIYVQVSYDEYKVLEEQMREFRETVHTTVTGFYHKSIRLNVGDTVFEFHGPAVKGEELESSIRG